MSALPAPKHLSRGEPFDEREWITIDEAAARLGRNVQHLARLCRDQLETLALATKFRPPPPEGGNERWYIARRWKPALAHGAAGEAHVIPSLDQYSKRQVEVAWQRAECVERYRDARADCPGSMDQWKPLLVSKLGEQFPGLAISERTLDRWFKRYRDPADIVKLIDTRGGNQKGKADPEALDHFKAIYLDQNQPSMKGCWEQTRDAARANGWQWCSYSQLRRKLDDLVPPQLRAQFRDPRKYRQAFRPYISQDPEAFFVGERWDSDHAQLDLWCRYQGRVVRPWITCWMDWRTRRIVGYVLTDQPNSSTIMAALRVGLLDPANHGGPDLVWIDNGKDYDCYTLHGQTKKERKRKITERVRLVESEAGGIFGMLKIEAHFSIPHNPNGKSRVERWFGTRCDQFDKRFITYCGSSSATKPERLNDILKRGNAIPDFAVVEEELAGYVAQYNAWADHARLDMQGYSPDSMMAEIRQRERRMADPDALDQILQHWHPPVAVGRNGLRLTLKGKSISFGQFNQSLARFKGTGRKLHVSYSPEDIRTVRVYDEDHRFICTAAMNQLGGARDKISLTKVGELIREQRRYKAAKREVNAGWKHEVFNTPEMLRDRARPDPPPPEAPPMQLIPTPMDGQGEEVREVEQRKAAGAEGQRVVPLLDLERIAWGGEYVNRMRRAEETGENPLELLMRTFGPDAEGPYEADEEFTLDLVDLSDLIDDATDGEPMKEVNHAQ